VDQVQAKDLADVHVPSSDERHGTAMNKSDLARLKYQKDE